ncbi:MAG: hypothetical protein AB8B83_05465 [Bdellovibrionales bacterium]
MIQYGDFEAVSPSQYKRKQLDLMIEAVVNNGRVLTVPSLDADQKLPREFEDEYVAVTLKSPLHRVFPGNTSAKDQTFDMFAADFAYLLMRLDEVERMLSSSKFTDQIITLSEEQRASALVAIERLRVVSLDSYMALHAIEENRALGTNITSDGAGQDLGDAPKEFFIG